MTSSELLQQLKETRELVQIIKSQSNEYYEFYKMPLPFLPTLILLGAWIFVIFQLNLAKPFMSFLDTFIFNPFVAPLDLPHYGNAIIVGTAVVFQYGAPILLIAAFINKQVVSQRLRANAKRMMELRNNIERDIDALSHSIVPEDYWDESIIEKLEKYVTNKRASTLKECLNLYEQDRMHEETIGRIEAAEAAAFAARAEAASARKQADYARSEAERLESEAYENRRNH
ncbi:hypothetical protein N0M98_09455 [Paenibacillus doosanensis]|uniref:hypothetical protein n=1 Tax=Paenibacillus doosanensis TaxID=1229154 RepID=UPI00217FF65A|nr:hypothetical protein [Paenibacillus doosanensis]MCS7460367.1 hypothetical protein [Paenibacillus doosanensis]